MKTTRALYCSMVAVGIAVLLTAAPARLSAQQTTDPAIRIGDNDLGGVVTSANGPEAGVWVIAETTDLPTKLLAVRFPPITREARQGQVVHITRASLRQRHAMVHGEGGSATYSGPVPRGAPLAPHDRLSVGAPAGATPAR